MGGIRELLDGKNMGMGFKFQMGMGMKSLKWEVIGTKNLFPHTSSRNGLACVSGLCKLDACSRWCLAGPV